MHAVNDALFAGVYPLLPMVALDLGLSYGEVGAIKSLLGASSAILQVPAGMLAEVVGEHLLLAGGTAWVGAGFAAMALATAFLPLVVIASLAGLGGNTQHPVANAAVARRFDDAARPGAIGTLNFAGDVGKIVAPLVGGAGAALAGWQGGLAALGLVGVAFSVAYAVVVPVRLPRRRGLGPDATRPSHRVGAPSSRPDGSPPREGGRRAAPWHAVAWGIARPGPYAALTLIGSIDAAARGAALALLPFAFARAGMDAAEVGFAFSILFGAGAAGKFLCGPLAARHGLATTVIATEVVTAAGIILIPVAPEGAILWAILPFGFALNGTSSVLYALVAPLSLPAQRARAYGLYYTAVLLATAAAPLAYGAVADVTGLTIAFAMLGVATLAVVPLAWRWRVAFAGVTRAR